MSPVDGFEPLSSLIPVPGPLPIFSSSVGQQIITSFAPESFVLCSLQESFLLKTSCSKKNPCSKMEARTGLEKPQSWNAITVSPVGADGSQCGQMQDPAGPVYEACMSPSPLGLRNWAFAPPLANPAISLIQVPWPAPVGICCGRSVVKCNSNSILES